VKIKVNRKLVLQNSQELRRIKGCKKSRASIKLFGPSL